MQCWNSSLLVVVGGVVVLCGYVLAECNGKRKSSLFAGIRGAVFFSVWLSACNVIAVSIAGTANAQEEADVEEGEVEDAEERKTKLRYARYACLLAVPGNPQPKTSIRQ